MSQEWDVLEFVERFRDGEFDGHLGETLNLLSPDQIEDLQHFLREGESCNRTFLEDLKPRESI